MKRLVTMVAIAASTALARPALLDGQRHPALPECLAEAKVVSTAHVPRGGVALKLQIIHVFWGDKSAVGRTFEETAPKCGEGSTGPTGWRLFPPPRVGEAIIWALETREDGRIMHDPRCWFPLPSRRCVHEEYPDARKFCETVERYGALPLESRHDFLLKSARSDLAYASSWAIRELAAAGTRDDLAFLRALGEPGALAPLVQADLDEVLLARDPQWQDSGARRDLLQSWMTNACHSMAAARHVQSHLRVERQEGRLGDGRFLELMRLAANNEQMPPEARRNAVTEIAALTGRPEADIDPTLMRRPRNERVASAGVLCPIVDTAPALLYVACVMVVGLAIHRLVRRAAIGALLATPLVFAAGALCYAHLGRPHVYFIPVTRVAGALFAATLWWIVPMALTYCVTRFNVPQAAWRALRAAGPAVFVAARRLRRGQVPRYSLRTLLLVTTGFAMLCSFVAAVTASRRAERASSEFIESSGGCVEWSDGHVTAVYLGGSALTDSMIVRLGAFPELRILNLAGSDATDEHIALLGHPRMLRVLHLGHTQITDASVEGLAAIHSLALLDVASTRLSSEGIERLRGALIHAEVVAEGE